MRSPSTDRLADVASLDELYAELSPLSVVPGWNAPEAPLWSEPRKTFAPMHWRYAWARKALDAAGRLIDTSVAERRNLVLTNSEARWKFATTRTMVAAYQMVLPGERARSHQHLSCCVGARSGRFVLAPESLLLVRLRKDIRKTLGCQRSAYP